MQSAWIQKNIVILHAWANRPERRQQFPRTCRAIDDLRAALRDEQVPSKLRRSWQRRSRCVASRRRPQTGDPDPDREKDRRHNKMRQRLHRAQQKVSQLEAQVERLTQTKAPGGFVSQEWILRVLMAPPTSSGRAQEANYRMAAGVDRTAISRMTVPRIRAAFLEMWNDMTHAAVRRFVAAQYQAVPRGPAAGGPRFPRFLSVQMLHVQDEADMRMLTVDASSRPGLPRRARTSKVQFHSLTLRCRGREFLLPQELEALADKTARTLATSLLGVLRTWLPSLLVAVPAAAARKTTELWFLHCLIGDGIPTNEAAAKILWAMGRKGGEAKGTAIQVRYFLLLAHCGTHQSALSAKFGVIGRAAAAAAESDGGGKAFEDVTATAVRLFKYLTPQYYEDFKKSSDAWASHLAPVSGTAPDGPPAAAVSGPAPDGMPASWADLRALYTPHVIPDFLVESWDASAATARSDFVLKKLLYADQHPTLTRFFTFRTSVDAMLTMMILDFPDAGLTIKTTARDENKRRVTKVKRFFRNPGAMQALKRDSLVLQITAVAEAFLSRIPAEGEPPIVVRILKDELHDLVNGQVWSVLGNLHRDPKLHAGPAVVAILATAMDLVARLNVFKGYPFRFAKMCRKWFPPTYQRAINEFLREPSDALDAGYSLPLQEMALAQPDEWQQTSFMMSDEVQAFLEDGAHIFMNSLHAERAAAEVKRAVDTGGRSSLLSSVSRDMLCRRFDRWRRARALELEQAEDRVRSCFRRGWASYVWQRPEGRRSIPDGQPYDSTNAPKSSLPRHEEAASTPIKGRSISASLLADSGRKPTRPRSRSRAVAQPRAAAAPAQPSLEVKVRALQERRLAIQAAKDDLHRLKQQTLLPVTRQQWAEWLDKNLDELRDKMTTIDGAQSRRMHRNVRVGAASGLAPPVRLQPRKERLQLSTVWAQLLQWRTGWHGVRIRTPDIELEAADSGRRMFFLTRHRSQTYVLELETYRVAGPYPYILNKSFCVTDAIPLSSFEKIHKAWDVLTVYWFHVEGAPTSGALPLRPVKWTEITTALQYGAGRTKKDEEKGKDTEAEQSDMSVDSCEDLGDERPSDVEPDEEVIDLDLDKKSFDGSGNSCTSGAETETESSEADVDDATAGGPAAGGPSKERTSGGTGPTIFDNGYFYIKANKKDLKAFIHPMFLTMPPHGVGPNPTMTKTITPHTVGETRDDPVRSLLCLRAWIIWRARGALGWLARSSEREHVFREEADQLYLALRRLQPQCDGVAGNADATKYLRLWVPDLVTKLTTPSPCGPAAGGPAGD